MKKGITRLCAMIIVSMMMLVCAAAGSFAEESLAAGNDPAQTTMIAELQPEEGSDDPQGPETSSVDSDEEERDEVVIIFADNDPVDPTDPVDPVDPVDPPADNTTSTVTTEEPVEETVTTQPDVTEEVHESTEPSDVTRTYEITYKYFDDEGEQELVTEVAEDSVIELPELAPELEGYVFLFWYNPDQEFENDEICEFVFGEAPTTDLILRALYIEVIPEEGDELPQENETAAEGAEVGEEDGDPVDPVDPALNNDIDVDDVDTNEDEIVEAGDENVDPSKPESDDNLVGSGFITIIDDPQEDEGQEEEDTEPAITVNMDDEENEEDNATPVVIVEEEDAPPVVIVEDDDEEEADENAEGTSVMTIEEEELPLAGPAVEEHFDILLSSNHGDCIGEGELLTVMATLIGYEAYTVELQWFYNDGTGWYEAEGANELSYSFVATSETVNYNWRLAVTITGYAEGI